MNLFIALVFDTYLLVKSTKPNGIMMRADERRWLDYEARLLGARAEDMRPPQSRVRRTLYAISRHKLLNYFIIIVM